MSGIRKFLTLIIALAVIWGVGFWSFAGSLNAVTSVEDTPVSDAIVVLTGGSKRIGEGFALMEAGKGGQLLISGVDPTVATATLATITGRSEQLFDCCVTLGRNATNTVGNAEEAKLWVNDQGFNSLTIVTAHYHMPRAMLAFKERLTTTALIPHPVVADVTLRYLAIEYNKYLFALIVGA